MIITIDVPDDFICDWYETATAEDAADALRIGSQLFMIMKTMKSTEDIQKLEAIKNKEIEQIRESSAAATRLLQEQISQLDSDIITQQININQVIESQRKAMATESAEALTKINTAANKKIADIQYELKMLQEKYDAALIRRRELENNRDADIRIAEERTRILMQNLIDEKERAIQRADKTLGVLQDAYDKQADEMRQLSDLIRKKPTANVKLQGIDYENIFREKLIATFGLGEGFELIDTAKIGTGHAGDFIMKWGTHKIMWEVKNYNKAVPTSEVDKFRRDMKENPHINIGVMVSRYTPITGKTGKGNREVEIMENKLLIYLSVFETMEDDTLANLLMLFRVWWSVSIGEITDNVASTIKQIETLHTDAIKAKTDWRLHKSRMEETIRWMAERVEDYEYRLKNVLNALQSGVSEMGDIPTGIFRDCTGDPKAYSDITLILKFTTPDPMQSVQLAELADIIAKEKVVSRTTAVAHIKSVLLDESISAQKGKPTRIIGLKMGG